MLGRCWALWSCQAASFPTIKQEFKYLEKAPNFLKSVWNIKSYAGEKRTHVNKSEVKLGESGRPGRSHTRFISRFERFGAIRRSKMIGAMQSIGFRQFMQTSF